MSQENKPGQTDPLSETDKILDQWRRVRPDLDPSPMAVCGDIWRAAERLRQAIQLNWGKFDIDLPSSDVLLTLRRQGHDDGISPTALAKDSMLSASAMTNRLDRIEKRGLIERRADPTDRRALTIHLTKQGRELVDHSISAHLEEEERLLARLSGEEREQLRQLLSKIAVD
jgi:DNA-binding MarR family transcriptional regulator